MSGCGKMIKRGKITAQCGQMEPGADDTGGIRAFCRECGGDYDALFDPTKGEPQPIPGKGRSVIDEVIKDLEARRQVGIVKYGETLKTNNGRNPLMDAYQEVLDLANYIKQCLMEQEEKLGKTNDL